MSSGGVGTANEDSYGQKSGGTAAGGPADSLLQGAYDEANSHNQFLEALNAWRNAGKPDDLKANAADKGEKVSFFKII